jgi:hypothetical protein
LRSRHSRKRKGGRPSDACVFELKPFSSKLLRDAIAQNGKAAGAIQRTVAQIEADLASLWTHADTPLKLAQEHAAAGNLPIAKKMTEVARALKADITKLRSELCAVSEGLREIA